MLSKLEFYKIMNEMENNCVGKLNRNLMCQYNYIKAEDTRVGFHADIFSKIGFR